MLVVEAILMIDDVDDDDGVDDDDVEWKYVDEDCECFIVGRKL